MSQTTIQLRQSNPDETDNMAKLDSANDNAYGYLSRGVADELGEYLEVTLTEEADVNASLDGVTGKGTGNYARFETPGGAVTGFGIGHDVWTDVFDTEVERDEDDRVANAPDSIGMTFAASSEEDFDSAEAVEEDEIEGLLASGDDSDDEEEVEITDEELSIVDE